MTLPNVHSFYVNAPDLDEQRAMAAALGYDVTEVPTLALWYVTWRKLGVTLGAPPTVGELWVDLSRHNWPVDIKAMKAAGVKRIYARATLGANGVDERWTDIRNAVLAENMPLGAYHLFIWNEDGERQADNFKRVTQDFCSEGPVADCERRRNVPTADPNVFLPEVVDKTVAGANLLKLMAHIGAPDTPQAGLYSSKNEWEAMFNLSAEQVAAYWKWVAQYRSNWNFATDLPDRPAGWWPRLWQYKVAAPGELTWHPRALDLNRYMGEAPPAAAPVDPPPPLPWWQTKAPPYNLAVPNKVIQFYTENGVALIAKLVTWTMRVTDRRGDLLLVFDQVGTVGDWWVRAADVTPA
jgi:hypothetical protein